ncbi:DUF1778 domain-containing protein, partial [Dysosmobacter welbionis]
GQKAQYTAHSREHAVDHQAVDHGVQSIGGEAAVHRRGEGIDPRGQQIRQEGADDFKGQEEDAQ